MRATLILGAGPGGTGPLVWAAQHGVLTSWLASGLTVVDAGPVMGGTLGRYIINSDSLGGVYLEFLRAPLARDTFACMAEDPARRALEQMQSDFPPLSLVDRYLHRMGAAIAQAVIESPGGEFLPNTTARALHRRADGSIVADVTSADGRSNSIEARTVILALGGRPRTAVAAPIAPGVTLADLPADKIIPSDQLMTEAGRGRAVAILQRSAAPRVVILGGSHSAFSAAWVLTQRMPEIGFGAGEIRIVARRQPPIYYESLAAAAADGYRATLADVCPKTQRVNRMGGLRGDGREVWRRLNGRPGCASDPRIVFVPLNQLAASPPAARRELDEATLIVPCFGYQASTIPVFDERGRRIGLNADRGGSAVGADARMLCDDGRPIANLFCIGLGTGYRPTAAMGGEPSFAGQANSLWLYQNHIGGIVYQGVQECLAEAASADAIRLRPRSGGGLIAGYGMPRGAR